MPDNFIPQSTTKLESSTPTSRGVHYNVKYAESEAARTSVRVEKLEKEGNSYGNLYKKSDTPEEYMPDSEQTAYTLHAFGTFCQHSGDPLSQRGGQKDKGIV